MRAPSIYRSRGLVKHPEIASGSMQTLARTPLYERHLALGARMVPFAGWDMPVQYTSVLDEHMAVRTKAGLFDVSHMGEVAVRGRDALAFLQHVTSNDVSRLTPGRIQYSALTTPQGTFVDDLLVYKLAEDDYLLVINAGNTPKDAAWLAAEARAFDVDVADVSARWCQLALQGPAAESILAPLTATALSAIKYYGFERGEVAGVPCLVSRTGYTGEDGFELYGPWEEAERLWHAVLSAGAPEGLVPAGLAARDTLRLEAAMRLYGNDMDEHTTVLEADLGWIVGWKKAEFIGADVLRRQRAEGVPRKLIGFEVLDRGIARHGHEVFVNGERAGVVTSGTQTPFLKKSIGMAYLPSASATAGTEFEIDVRGRRLKAQVVPMPFYKRPR